MRNILIYLVLGLTFSSLAFSQINCTPVSVESNYQDALKGIEIQVVTLRKVLGGEDLGDFAVTELFGHDYKVEKSAEHIKMLKDQMKKEGVAPEHMSLKNCLVELKRDSDLNKLKEVSSARHELRVKLFEKNKDLKGSLKESLEGQSEIPTLKKELTESKKNSELEKQELEKDLIESETKFLSENNGEI